MLTYDVCRNEWKEEQDDDLELLYLDDDEENPLSTPRATKDKGGAVRGQQVLSLTTYFTGTKVQILTLPARTSSSQRQVYIYIIIYIYIQ
jgi:hypothetical protein